MADENSLDQLTADFRERMQAGHGKARIRIGVTAALVAFVFGYMGWIYQSVSKLDADTVAKIARMEVQSRLPDMGDQLTQMAMDAAPELLDRAERAILTAPAALRDGVEARMLEGTDAMIEQMAERLDAGLTEAIEPRLDAVKSASGGESPTLDELMGALRDAYRTKAKSMTDELYVATAEEISGVNEFLVHLKTADNLTPRERVQKEIIEASVALRRHFIEPIEPTTLAAEETER